MVLYQRYLSELHKKIEIQTGIVCYRLKWSIKRLRADLEGVLQKMQISPRLKTIVFFQITSNPMDFK